MKKDSTPKETRGHPVSESLLEKNSHLSEFLPFLDQLNKESERGAVLISAAYIDDQLAQVLEAYLLEAEESKDLIIGFNAPLGTFSARAMACLSLGVVGRNEFNDCQIIRKIRNEFAHSTKACFADRKIIDLCANLHFSAKSYDDVVVSPHGQFTTAAASLILSLTNRPHYVSRERLSLKSWQY